MALQDRKMLTLLLRMRLQTTQPTNLTELHFLLLLTGCACADFPLTQQNFGLTPPPAICSLATHFTLYDSLVGTNFQAM